MKILMVLESAFPPDKRVEKEMVALTEAGHTVELACSVRNQPSSTGSWEGVVIHRRKMSKFIYRSSVGCLKFPFYFNFWRKHVFSILDKSHFDVIHIHDLPLIRIGTEAKERYGILLVSDLHENYPALLKDAVHTKTLAGRILSSDRQWSDYEKKYLAEANLVISVVEEASERIEGLGIDPSRLCIVSNTFELDFNAPLPIREQNETFTLFYGGAVNRHRGLQVVMQAMKLLKDRGTPIRLMIVGSGSYLDNLRELASKLEIVTNVTFYGFRPFNEMMELLGKADAGIIPHLRTENNDASSPNKLYQYMYVEKPVISSDCRSLKRIITEADCGFIYKADSPAELADLIGTIKDNKQLLAGKGKNGHKAVISKYNWTSDRERLLAAYKSLQHP